MKIKVKHISSWVTVIIPTIFFLFILITCWIGIPYLLYSYFNVKNTTLLNLLSSTGWIWGSIVAIVFSIMFYKKYWNFAQKLVKTKFISLDDAVLSWGKNKIIDLSLPYYANISAGISATGTINSSIYLKNKRYTINFHMANFSREEFLRYFQEEEFIDTFSISIYEGSFGYELNNNNNEERNFYISLIKALWKYKHNNEYYIIYQKFPWHHQPNPDFKNIQIYDSKNMYFTQKTFIEQIKNNSISSPVDYIFLTPDYILVCDTNKYVIMPIGYVYAETQIKESTHYIIFNEKNNKNKNKNYQYMWIAPLNNKFYESEFFVKYINKHYFNKQTNDV